MEEWLRRYYFVGGMPEVVDNFVKNADLAQVRQLQQTILEAYFRTKTRSLFMAH